MVSRNNTQDTYHRALPRPTIDARPTGRRPLYPYEKRLIKALKIRLVESGISHSGAGRIAGIDPGDARRVLSGGHATPRTLRRLFDAFDVHEYKELSNDEREKVLLIELGENCRRTADLADELVTILRNETKGEV